MCGMMHELTREVRQGCGKPQSANVLACEENSVWAETHLCSFALFMLGDCQSMLQPNYFI